MGRRESFRLMDLASALPIGQFVDAHRLAAPASIPASTRLDPWPSWSRRFCVDPSGGSPWLGLFFLLLLWALLKKFKPPRPPFFPKKGASVRRLWRRNLPALLRPSACWWAALCPVLPTRADPASGTISDSPQEADAGPVLPASPQPSAWGEPWRTACGGPVQLGPALPLGPWWSNRRSAELGLNSPTLLFTLIHKRNLAGCWSTPPRAGLGPGPGRSGPLRLLGPAGGSLGSPCCWRCAFWPLVQGRIPEPVRRCPPGREPCGKALA